MKKYRVVTDAYAGYEVQVKESWYSPWLQAGTNTSSSIEEAIQLIDKKKEEDAKKASSGRVVYNE